MQLILTPQEGSALCGLLVEDTNDIILKTDPAGFIVQASAGIERLGLSLTDTLVWPHLADLAGAGPAGTGTADAIRAAHRDIAAGRRGSVCIEFARGLPDGRHCHFALQLRALSGEDGEGAGGIGGVLGVLRDIDERRSLEERLFVADMTDALTGVTNRRAFTAMLAHLAAMPGEHCLALVDIDHFKAINRRHGGATGDDVLVAVADFLRAALSARDTISRVGGASFAVLLPWTAPAAAEAICREVVTTIENISRAATGGAFPITVSGGLAPVLTSPDATIERAEAALFMARANGGNRLAIDRTGQRR